MGLKFYTSYYKKMMDYPKDKERDLFVQVSRTRPFWFVRDGKSLVDENWGEALGNFSENLDDYWGQLESIHDVLEEELVAGIKENIKAVETNTDLQNWEGKIFLLCYENIEKKPCHRRIIAKYFEEKFGIPIPEWEG
jgi:hypothetical protein